MAALPMLDECHARGAHNTRLLAPGAPLLRRPVAQPARDLGCRVQIRSALRVGSAAAKRLAPSTWEGQEEGEGCPGLTVRRGNHLGCAFYGAATLGGGCAIRHLIADMTLTSVAQGAP